MKKSNTPYVEECTVFKCHSRIYIDLSTRRVKRI